jgi:hypothetical protein
MTATTATATATDCLRQAIELDFIATCDELAQARHRQRRKDSTTNRASVAACRARLDAILDMHLAAEGARRAISGRG